MDKILIIEDDEAIASIERDYLEIDHFQVEIAADGVTGLNRGLGGEFDLILLDLMLTARQEDIDKILGLGLGADDYIEKPFSPGVLVARVKASLAQYRRLSEPQKAPSEITLGGIRLNTGTHRVFVDGNEVELKNKEYELLLFLMLNVDMVFDRETLYEKVWGLDAMGDNATVAVHINRLREKLEKEPANPRYIETVWAQGIGSGGENHVDCICIWLRILCGSDFDSGKMRNSENGFHGCHSYSHHCGADLFLADGVRGGFPGADQRD